MQYWHLSPNYRPCLNRIREIKNTLTPYHAVHSFLFVKLYFRIILMIMSIVNRFLIAQVYKICIFWRKWLGCRIAFCKNRNNSIINMLLSLQILLVRWKVLICTICMISKQILHYNRMMYFSQIILLLILEYCFTNGFPFTFLNFVGSWNDLHDFVC